MSTLAELLEDQLKDIYYAEKLLLKSMPKMTKKATTPSLKEAFTTHQQQTEEHVRRLDECGQILGYKKMTGKKCHAMDGLVEEAQEVIKEGEPGPVLDAGLIAAGQRVEHYEIAAYGNAKALAKVLGHADVVRLLQETLNEEGATDKLLTKVAQKDVLPAALASEEDEDVGEEEHDEEGEEQDEGGEEEEGEEEEA